MINLIKRIFNIMSQKNKYDGNTNMICNNPSVDLNSFCALEYAYVNKRSN